MKFLKKLFFNFHNYRYRKNRNKNTFRKFSKKKIKNYYQLNIKKKKIILATQVGRGGGKWLADMINQCDDVSAFGERHRLEESIFRHDCSYNNKKRFNDILHIIKSEALSDWKFNNISYISSPYFSHGIKFLEKNLRSDKFVIIVRDFDGLLFSLLNKGWYKENIEINLNKHSKKPPKIFLRKPNQFFGRYINLNEDNEIFLKSSRPVKVAIFMYQTLKKIFEDMIHIKKNKIVIFDLNKADQNYKYCKRFLKKLNINLDIEKQNFLGLKKRTAISIENEIVSIDKKDLIEIKKIKVKYNYYLKKIKRYI